MIFLRRLTFPLRTTADGLRVAYACSAVYILSSSLLDLATLTASLRHFSLLSPPPPTPPLSSQNCAVKCVSQCERDDFDRFGGRETPTVLRRSFLSGGGEKSWKAVEELRRELAITEVSALFYLIGVEHSLWARCCLHRLHRHCRIWVYGATRRGTFSSAMERL